MVGKIGRRGRGVVGVFGVMAMTGVAFAQPVGADDGASVDAVTVVEDLVGNQTAGGVVAAGGDTAVVVATAGTVVDVPMDPSDGIAVDLAGSGADVAITPLDPGLDDFARDGAMATAEAPTPSSPTSASSARIPTGVAVGAAWPSASCTTSAGSWQVRSSALRFRS